MPLVLDRRARSASRRHLFRTSSSPSARWIDPSFVSTRLSIVRWCAGALFHAWQRAPRFSGVRARRNAIAASANRAFAGRPPWRTAVHAWRRDCGHREGDGTGVGYPPAARRATASRSRSSSAAENTSAPSSSTILPRSRASVSQSSMNPGA